MEKRVDALLLEERCRALLEAWLARELFTEEMEAGGGTHLSLPLHGVDEDDALREALVRDEDLVQLVVNRLPGDL